MPKIKVIREDLISEEELRTTILNARSREIKAFICFLALTGGRISEVRGIRGKDIEVIDDNSWSVNVVTLKQRQKDWEIPKRRTLKIVRDSLFEKIIRPYINEGNFKGEMFLFPHSSVFYWKQLKLANPNVYPHLFRHTLATAFSERVDVWDLKEWFGWKGLNMANEYVHPKRAIENIYQKNKELMEKKRNQDI